MAYESVKRIFAPIEIAFNESIAVACIGLMVNLLSAWALKEDHHHEHDAELGPEDKGHDGHDHNLRSAYLHVLADALTSILAIIALSIGRFWGLIFLDPLMGIVGAVVISCWAFSLMRDTASVLLDVNHNTRLNNRIREAVEENNAKISDLHVWRLGFGHYSAIISLSAPDKDSPEYYKTRLCTIKELSHVTVEIN
jgi:cation diffusion facilitator family transporter